MSGLFEVTVSALCYEISRSQDSGFAPIDTPPFNDVTNFVLDEWKRMPRFLAWPIRMATVVFACRGVVTAGRFFHQLEPARREVQMDSWSNSSIGPFRDIIRFYRSLAILALYSRTGRT